MQGQFPSLDRASRCKEEEEEAEVVLPYAVVLHPRRDHAPQQGTAPRFGGAQAETRYAHRGDHGSPGGCMMHAGGLQRGRAVQMRGAREGERKGTQDVPRM